MSSASSEAKDEHSQLKICLHFDLDDLSEEFGEEISSDVRRLCEEGGGEFAYEGTTVYAQRYCMSITGDVYPLFVVLNDQHDSPPRWLRDCTNVEVRWDLTLESSIPLEFSVATFECGQPESVVRMRSSDVSLAMFMVQVIKKIENIPSCQSCGESLFPIVSTVHHPLKSCWNCIEKFGLTSNPDQLQLAVI